MSLLQPALTIIAEQADCNVPTVRYYEEIGLLPKAVRRASGHRIYGANDLQRLIFVRRCRDFDFPIERIRDLVSLIDSPNSDCTHVRDLAEAHLAVVRKKLVELQELEHGLAKFAADCTEQCVGGPSKDCVILGDLNGKASCCARYNDRRTDKAQGSASMSHRSGRSPSILQSHIRDDTI